MRSKLFVFASATTLTFITLTLIARQPQIKYSLDGTAIGLFEKFRSTTPTGDSQVEDNSSVLIEHTDASDRVVPHKIGMVSMLIGDTNPTFERALRTHLRHGEIQGYETFVMRSQVLDMLYNKPMFILDILMNEMKKPFHERLEWLLWFDCDSVLLNPMLGLSHFLPPPEYPDANVLVTKDGNGLNNGVFFIRVCAWAVEVMAANLAYRIFNPHEQLTFQDQSALEHIFDMDKFRNQVVYCPQRWFNAYQSGFLNESIEANQVRRGDLIVHFAGVGDKIERMNYWCDIAEKHSPDWEVDIIHTSYLEEIEEFWSQKKSNDEIERQELQKARTSAELLIGETERNLTLYRVYMTMDEQTQINNRLQKVREHKEKENAVLIWEAIRELKEANSKLEELDRQTRKQTIKDAHAAIIAAEKIGVNADQLREILIEANNWTGIQTATKDLKAKVDLEVMRAQMEANIKQEMNQALNQTANETLAEASNLLNGETSSQLASESIPPATSIVGAVFTTARAGNN